MSSSEITTNSSKRFQINRTSFARHYDVQSSSGSHLYYVDESTFTPGKPDLTIHNGASTSAPILAVSHMPKFSGDFKIGLGDPSKPSSIQWEDMTKESLTASEYHWFMTLPDTDAKDEEIRRKFVWKRTHNVGVEGFSALSNRNYKLLDGKTGEILATFTKDGSFTKCGVLQINVDYGSWFELMVLITCLTLYEKSRRRKNRRKNHGGGGP